MFTKEDFLGQNSDITTARGATRILTSNILPIFLQNAIDEFDAANSFQSLVRGAISLPGINTRDLRKEDLREDSMRRILPSGDYVNQEPYMKQYASGLVNAELLGLDQKRADNQAAPGLSGPDLNIIGQGMMDAREESLIVASLDPNLEPFALYSKWKNADAFYAGGKKARSEGFDEIYGNLPTQLADTEAEQAFNIYRSIFDEPDFEKQKQYLAAFEMAYPPDSEVGQYLLRNRNRNRVPMTMIQKLSGYRKAQGILESAYARYTDIYAKVARRGRAGGSPAEGGLLLELVLHGG